ncbi:MAG: polyprenyl synthetase family protein [Clostridia bacterium]|nr:polyprenyl synthetase family protein [Clostridia bacterium]
MKTLKEYAAIVENRFDALLPELSEGTCEIGGMPWLLASSMRYSLLAGGKRLRPSMLLACVDMLGGDVEAALDIACSVEMIHTYSLIHDDLPGMDNDSMRRGRPTNHVVFGEGQAILAGDGLLNNAFETMLKCGIRYPERALSYLKAINEIACGSGVTGMVAGQVMDLYCEREKTGDEAALKYIQRDKTACMFIYPLRAAGHLCNADEKTLEALTTYGEAFGLLFQATDDLLDVIGDSKAVGKTLGKDAESGKLTCISEYGIEGTRELVKREHARAREAMSLFGDKAAFFNDLVDSMVERTY